MKNLKIYYTIFSFLTVMSLTSQELNDSTFIQKIEVSYLDQDYQLMDSVKMVRAQSKITLKSDSLVSLIHFKIIKESDGSSVYQADYSTTSASINNNEGLILFKKEGNTIYINSSSQIPLNIYLYQITTEDAQGNISEPFIEYH